MNTHVAEGKDSFDVNFSIPPSRKKFFRKFTSLLLSFIFSMHMILPAGVSAQMVSSVILPPPGTMVTPAGVYEPPLLKGLTLHADNPFEFDFIFSRGEETQDPEALQAEAGRMVRYFMAALTVPEKDMWVNLNPQEQDRIIPGAFSVTEMGRDLLAQDYLLKQMSASLLHPEEKAGSSFWEEVYRTAYEKFGTTQIPVNTFNKVWVMADEATVYQHGTSALVVNSRLKVLTEEDLRSLDANLPALQGGSAANTELNEVSAAAVRQAILPVLEREVNEGKTFARLRQVYHAFILASWFKQTLKDSLVAQVYANRSKVGGIDMVEDGWKDKVFEQYLAAYRKGVVNLIREDHDPATRQVVPRKYFSGGIHLASSAVGNSTGSRGTTSLAASASPLKVLTRMTAAVWNFIRKLNLFAVNVDFVAGEPKRSSNDQSRTLPLQLVQASSALVDDVDTLAKKFVSDKQVIKVMEEIQSLEGVTNRDQIKDNLNKKAAEDAREQLAEAVRSWLVVQGDQEADQQIQDIMSRLVLQRGLEKPVDEFGKNEVTYHVIFEDPSRFVKQAEQFVQQHPAIPIVTTEKVPEEERDEFFRKKIREMIQVELLMEDMKAEAVAQASTDVMSHIKWSRYELIRSPGLAEAASEMEDVFEYRVYLGDVQASSAIEPLTVDPEVAKKLARDFAEDFELSRTRKIDYEPSYSTVELIVIKEDLLKYIKTYLGGTGMLQYRNLLPDQQSMLQLAIVEQFRWDITDRKYYQSTERIQAQLTYQVRLAADDSSSNRGMIDPKKDPQFLARMFVRAAKDKKILLKRNLIRGASEEKIIQEVNEQLATRVAVWLHQLILIFESENRRALERNILKLLGFRQEEEVSDETFVAFVPVLKYSDTEMAAASSALADPGEQEVTYLLFNEQITSEEARKRANQFIEDKRNTKTFPPLAFEPSPANAPFSDPQWVEEDINARLKAYFIDQFTREHNPFTDIHDFSAFIAQVRRQLTWRQVQKRDSERQINVVTYEVVLKEDPGAQASSQIGEEGGQKDNAPGGVLMDPAYLRLEVRGADGQAASSPMLELPPLNPADFPQLQDGVFQGFGLQVNYMIPDVSLPLWLGLNTEDLPDKNGPEEMDIAVLREEPV